MVESYYPVLAYLTTEGNGPRGCFDLPDDPGAVYEALRSAAGRRWLAATMGCRIGDVNWAAFDKQINAIARHKVRVLTWRDPDYPAYLNDLVDRPPLLFVRGRTAAMDRRGIAIVGTRKATARGASFTRQLASELAANGVAVISGAARGIDTSAHEGALAGHGRTVAVVGTGIDIPYPPENSGLLDDIEAEGCVVSEEWMGTPPARYTFPKRNRLISALSHAVVVVEAGERSGSLITARWAHEQGRDVGAVPGFPGDARSRGSNRLLKNGAFVVESIDDVLAAVPMLGAARMARSGAKDTTQWTGVAAQVMTALGPTAVAVDEVARHIARPVAEIQAVLLELEIKGVVARDILGAYFTVK